MKISCFFPMFCFVALMAQPASARSRVHGYNPLDDQAVFSEEKSDLSLRGLVNLLESTLFKPFVSPDGESPTVDEKYFTQKLNPDDSSDSRTFQQRYYVYSAHASGPGAPVILYVCGESECLSRSFLGRFTEEVAKATGAHIVALEHRYYGKSIPFQLLTPENLKYLSTDNALADLASFQQFAMSDLGLNGKWLSIGGSYPGSLSAFYRLTHPEKVVGALASSAPVQARNAFEEYDSHVTQVVGPACAAALRNAVAAAEAAMNADAETVRQFKSRFNAEDVLDNDDFLYVLADVTADAVQYGYPEKLCAAMETSEDPVQAYSKYVREFLTSRQETAFEFSPAVALKLEATASDGGRQWTYQSCMEYGYWQDAHHDPIRSVRSRRINGDYDREYCRRAFGITQLADESAMNRKFYEPLLNSSTSRIFFTNGSNDPWSELSISTLRGNNTNPNTQAVMIDGKAHCSDLRALSESDPNSLKSARALFLDLAKSWLN